MDRSNRVFNSSAGFYNSLGEIKLIVYDFDGVFTDNRVYVSQDGAESVACWRSDGLTKIKRLSMPIWVISALENKTG